MADITKTVYKVTITNGNADPTFVGTKQLTPADLAVISPTGITTPQTPYVEWVSDTTTPLDGSVQIPAWKRSGTQYFVLPAASVVTFTTDIADEAIFYQGLTGKYANVDVKVEDGSENAPVETYKVLLRLADNKKNLTIEDPDGVIEPYSDPEGLTDFNLIYAQAGTSLATVEINGDEIHLVEFDGDLSIVRVIGTGTAKLNGKTINVTASGEIKVSSISM